MIFSEEVGLLRTGAEWGVGEAKRAWSSTLAKTL